MGGGVAVERVACGRHEGDDGAHNGTRLTAAMHRFRIARMAERPAKRERAIGGGSLLRKRERRRAMEASPKDFVFRREETEGRGFQKKEEKWGGRCCRGWRVDDMKRTMARTTGRD